MNRENQLLLTDEPAEFEKKKNRLKFKASQKLSIVLEEFREYASKL